MKRVLIPVICIVAISLLAAVLYIRFSASDVVITQAQIDDALKTHFPVSNTYYLLFRVTYSNPKVRLQPDSDRVEVQLDADLGIKLSAQPKSFGGTAVVTSGIAYHRETHQFFLSEPKITRMTLQGIPQEYLDKLTQLASNTAREYLQQYPIYTLEARDLRSSTTRLLLNKVEVRGNEVHATLGF